MTTSPSSAGVPVDTKHVVVEDLDEHAVVSALRDCNLSGGADVVATYEQRLAQHFGVAYAVACSSGTAAIHLSLLALGISTDDEVIVPATAPVMTALPVLAVGARPVFVDTTDVDSFALDLSHVERSLTNRTRTVVSVPMWGYPADGPELVAACRRWGLALIEDAAQAHGAMLGRRPLGTQGAIGAFSTHARKLICTGEGGFCLTDDHQLAERLTRLRNLGKGENGEGFGTAFGLNYKLAGIVAALGVAQLTRLDTRLALRRRIAARLTAAIGEIPGIAPFPVRHGGLANAYALLVTSDRTGSRALARELRDAGVVSDTVRYRYRPLYRTPVFGAFAGAACPNAEQLCMTLHTLPCHEGVGPLEEERIVGACRRAMQG
jgi:perosamine synthetase